MKKLISVVVMMVLICSAAFASAESLFPKIPTAVKEQAPSYGAPICYHDPYGKGALEYAAVAKELMLRI